jgi:hypothetical protein
MNDPEEYACLFAGSIELLMSLGSLMASIEKMQATGALIVTRESEQLDRELSKAREAIKAATKNWKPNPWDKQ